MLHYFLLGVIEGITEFLPISSTGHLILFNYFSGMDITSPFIKTFQISIQLGAVLAVVFYYFKDLIKLETIKLLALSVLPTIFLGLLFNDFVNKFLEMPLLVAINLIIGGVIILIAEYVYKNKNLKNPKLKMVENIDYKKGFILGTVQSIAMIPGVSRSGAIIIFGLFNNYKREVIAKFTFLLAVPTMLAATVYTIFKNKSVFFSDLSSSQNIMNLLVGFVTSFVVALLIVRYALPFIKKYSFVPFGIYRIVVGVILINII